MNGEETNLPATSLVPKEGEGSFERSESEPSPRLCSLFENSLENTVVNFVETTRPASG